LSDARDRPSPGRRVTSADVARLAGVSAGTVSHVLSGAKRVRPETRQAVEQAMAELGFRPSGLGRALARNSASAVGMIVPDITNPFFAELSLLVEQELSKRNFALLLANTTGDPDLEKQYLEDFVERGLDGIMFVAGDGTDGGLTLALSQFTPIVLIDRTVSGWTGDEVHSDAAAGARMIAAHLSELGHRRIAYLGADEAISTARMRGDALRAALADVAIELVVETTGSFELAEAPGRAEAILRDAENFTAVVAANDLLAISAAFVALRRGFHIPRDLTIIGYDDIPFSELVTPSLTTVRQARDQMAADAVRLLMEQVDGLERPAQQIEVRPELIVRGSSGPAPRVRATAKRSSTTTRRTDAHDQQDPQRKARRGRRDAAPR
jgi:LacI family transcriptional regulator